MSGGEEEEWDGGEDFMPALQPARMGWIAEDDAPGPRTRQPDTVLRIKFQSRDYSLRQFSETVLDAEAMILTFGAPFVWSPRRDWDMYIREELSERVTVRTVSLSSPLEIFCIFGAAGMTAAALNRWINVRKNWHESRITKAEADKAVAESKLVGAQADRDVEKAEVAKLAWSYLKQHLQSESQKDFDSLPEEHPLREMASRSVSALLELESASSESDKAEK